MTFQQIVQQIENKEIMPNRQPSLKPTQMGLSRLHLSLPKDLKKIILVAGTNGKGSVSKSLSHLLQSAGQRVGLYTSPHLKCITERIQINNQAISQKDFVKSYQQVEQKTADLCFSHFEQLTLMAVNAFFNPAFDQVVDFAIFEVGMGGTWDATNAIAHKTCVIARIGKDHEHLLGSRLYDIAQNKFGIVQQNALVIHHPLPSSLLDLKEQTQKTTHSQWKERETYELEVMQMNDEPHYKLMTQWGFSKISLPGRRGAENIQLALSTFQSLGFDPKKHIKSISDIHWPGRMSRLKEISERRVYLSGDHNEQGIQSLLDMLKDYSFDYLYFLVSVGKKKQVDKILEPLSQIPYSTLTLTTASFMGRTKAEYGKWLNQFPYFISPEGALRQLVKRSQKNDLIIVTGSLYLVGDILSSNWSR